MKEVVKPWGKELWLELNDSYCCKKIHVNAGARTSYQYHKIKLETICVISGEADVWIESFDGSVDVVRMGKDGFFTVPPRIKHRMVAITDLVFFEVSTPEVDDVVRVDDDFNR